MPARARARTLLLWSTNACASGDVALDARYPPTDHVLADDDEVDAMLRARPPAAFGVLQERRGGALRAAVTTM